MQRPEEGVGFSGAGIQGSCELPDMGAEKEEERWEGGRKGWQKEEKESESWACRR